MTESTPRLSNLPPATWSRLSPVLDCFEEAWQQGQRPALNDFLDRADPADRAVLLAELILIDLERRLAGGEAVRLEEYLASHPDLAGRPELLLDMAAHEFRVRRRLGQVPSPEEFGRRFPDLAGDLARRLGNVEDTPPARTPDAPSDAPVIPGYEVLGVLGRGGMGVVYKARHLGLNRLVALKMILGGAHATPEDTIRFLQEAEVVARVQHANVVQIYDLGRHDGRPYYTAELVEGGSLADRIRERPQPPRLAAETVMAVARAVAAVHRYGVVHRDLKPGNILLTAEGTPKVTDFGLAKRLEGGPELTRSNALVGTPCYMAPEQAGGHSARVGPAADVYALGAILYELLTGRPPFLAETPWDTVLQVVQHEPVPVRRLQPTAPGDLETVCLKCLRKEPQKRYASADALADDLQRFLAGEPILARPVGPAERVTRWAWRNPGVAALSATVVGLLVSGVVGLSTALVTISTANRELETKNKELIDANHKKEEARKEAQKNFDTAEAERLKVQQQKERLQKNLVFAKAQVKRYFDHLKNIPRDDLRVGDVVGLRKLQEEMETVANEYYDEFIKAGEDDDLSFYADLADALNQLATISREVHSQKKAVEIGEKAVTVLERLVKRYPDEPRYRLDLAGTHNDMGFAYQEEGQLDNAAGSFQRALAVLEQLPPDARASAEARSERAQMLGNLGTTLGQAGKPGRAEESLDAALKEFTRLADDFPDDPFYPVAVARIENNLANFRLKRNRPDEALALYERAADRLAKFLDAHPFLADEEQTLSTVATVNLGLAAGRLLDEKKEGAREKSGQAAEKAAAAWQKLVDRNPRVVTYRVGLARTHLIESYLAAKDGRADGAVGLAKRARDLLDEVAPTHPDFVELARTRALAFGTLALVLGEQADYAGALEWAEEAARAARDVRELQGDAPQTLKDLASARQIRALALTGLGHYDDALAAWNEVLAAYEGESKELFQMQRAICLAGRPDRYLDAITQLQMASVKSKRFPALTTAAVYARASATALLDTDPDLTDDLRKKRSERFAGQAMKELAAAEKLGEFKEAARLRELKESPHYESLRDRDDFRELLRRVEGPGGPP